MRSALTRELRERDRARLRELREKLASAKLAASARRARMRKVARVELKRAVSLLRDLRRSLRSASRAGSGVAKLVPALLEAEGRAEVRAASARITRTRKAQLDRSRKRAAVELRSKNPRKVAAGFKAKEKRAESEDFVRQNIAPELRPVWDRVRKGFESGTPHERLERFAEWVAWDPHEVERLQNLEHYEAAERMAREHARLEREMASGRRYEKHSASLAAHLAGVPF